MPASSHDTERPPMSDDALLARLGLDGSASDAQVEAAHEEVVAFLLRAPGPVRTWAELRLAEVDEAYAILGGPDRPKGNGPATLIDPVDMLDGPMAARAPAPPARRPTPLPSRQPPARPSGNGHRTRSALLGDALGGTDWYDEPAAPDRGRDRTGRHKAIARQNQRNQPARDVVRRFKVPLPRALVAGIAVVGVVAILFAGYNLGGGGIPGLTGTPDPGATGPVVDQAQVSAYMTRLAADAEDIEAMQGLANLYFAVSDFATAGLWLDKLLAVDPDNVSALLGSGAVAYNVADLEAAEAAWMRAAALDPDNVEVHYDLGFLYLAQDPPNLEMVRQEWLRVIELEPDGAFAKTVAGHLDSLAPSASGSPAPSSSADETPAGSPVVEATPAGSPATVPSPSAGS